MRSLPVEVVASSLAIDEYDSDPEDAGRLAFVLQVDLRSIGDASRLIRVRDRIRSATHPEEALDELALWAPASRHTVFLLRGDAREVRLPGFEFEERTTANAYLFGAVFFAVFAAIVYLLLTPSNRQPRSAWIRRLLSISTVMYGFSLLLWLLIGLFVWHRVPKILSGPNTTVSLSRAPSAYPPERFPPEVTITPAGARQLEVFQQVPRRLLTFSWRGRTLHGGLGHFADAYGELAAACPEPPSACQIHVNPSDRWDAEPPRYWDAAFFVPLGFLLVFAVGLALGGRQFR
jgi:hypothetical protein